MPADLVNLRRARKAKARTERDKQAIENRVAHGRSKAERAGTDSERENAVQKLDGHRHETEKS